MIDDVHDVEFGMSEPRQRRRLWNIGTLVIVSAAVAGGQWILTFRHDVRDGTWYGVVMVTVVIAAWFLLCYGFMLPFNVRRRTMERHFPGAMIFNGLRVQDLVDGGALVLSEQRKRHELINLPVVYGVKFDDHGLAIFSGIRNLTEVFRVAWAKVESVELEDVTDNYRVRHAVMLLVTSKDGLAALPIVLLGAGPAGAFVVPLTRRQELVERLVSLQTTGGH